MSSESSVTRAITKTDEHSRPAFGTAVDRLHPGFGDRPSPWFWRQTIPTRCFTRNSRAGRVPFLQRQHTKAKLASDLYILRKTSESMVFVFRSGRQLRPKALRPLSPPCFAHVSASIHTRRGTGREWFGCCLRLDWFVLSSSFSTAAARGVRGVLVPCTDEILP